MVFVVFSGVSFFGVVKNAFHCACSVQNTPLKKQICDPNAPLNRCCGQSRGLIQTQMLTPGQLQNPPPGNNCPLFIVVTCRCRSVPSQCNESENHVRPFPLIQISHKSNKPVKHPCKLPVRQEWRTIHSLADDIILHCSGQGKLNT